MSAIFRCAKRFAQQKMADIIYIVKISFIFDLEFFTTFINATKVFFSIPVHTLILGHVVFRV